ncbi:hypothetical protein IscW_ISCW009542, partial [Ixodes scapularis]
RDLLLRGAERHKYSWQPIHQLHRFIRGRAASGASGNVRRQVLEPATLNGSSTPPGRLSLCTGALFTK